MPDLENKVVEKKKFAKGLVTFTNFVIDSKEAEEIDSFLKLAIDIPHEIYEQKIARLREICKVREYTFENQIVLVGREVFTRILTNDTTYTGIINYGALGTSATAISDAQTTLVAEVKRKGVAVYSRTGDSATVRFFYSKADTSGTYQEFGTFIDGTSTVDTGVMFNRVLTGGWTKSASESLTVTVQFDLNPA